MNKNIGKILISASFFAFIDQITKYLATLYAKEPVYLIGDFFKFEYAENTGIAFSIPIPMALLIILNVALLIAIFYLIIKELNISQKLTHIASGMLLGGALGNLIDRLTNGFVIDFISIWKWPTFNMADVYIVAGILLLIIFYAKIKKDLTK